MDGIQVKKRSTKSLWAIQIYQNYMHPKKRFIDKNILVTGLYHGKPDMKVFFLPLMKELRHICDAGGLAVEKDGKKYFFLPLILQAIGDLHAKAEMQGMLNHNAYKACGFCFHPGIIVKSGINSKQVRYIRIEENIPLRDHQNMLEAYKSIQ